MDELVDSGVKALVIACNSASAACLRDARERYDVPVVEVVAAGGAPRRRRHPQRPGRRHRHDGDDHQRRVRGRVRRGVRRRGRHRGVPALRRVRRARRHQRPAAARARRGVPGAAEPGRRRHPRPRLHALPAAHRPALGGHGGHGDAGVERGGDGQGRLPGAAAGGPAAPRRRAAAARTWFRATGPAEPFARLSRRFLGPQPSSAGTAGTGATREADRPRLLGQHARPGLARRRATWSSRTASGWCSTSATARSARCSASSTRRRSTRSSSRTCTPTTASTSPPTSSRCATARTRPTRRDPGGRPGGDPRPAGVRVRPDGAQARPARAVRLLDARRRGARPVPGVATRR